MNEYYILKSKQTNEMAGTAFAESEIHVLKLAKAKGIAFMPCWYIKLIAENVIAEATIEIY